MTKRKEVFVVDSPVIKLEGKEHSKSGIKSSKSNNNAYKDITSDLMPIKNALDTVFNQMLITGNRKRTIESYEYVFNQFVSTCNIKYVEEINIKQLYFYLESLKVQQSTKLIRLKAIKSVLGKFYNNGWVKDRFWSMLNIKVNKDVKKGAKESDLEKLLMLIDQTTFIGFRDSCAIKLMYKTGIRINTLSELKEKHIDYNNSCLVLDGAVLKNHKYLKLPLSDDLLKMIKQLITINNGIRKHYNKVNTNIFITRRGNALNDSKSSNCAISKQLSKYAKKYNLKNINAHAIRRAYAKSLYDKGANIALISKALGHSDLAVTTQYLDLSVEEVANDLKRYM